MTTTNTFEEIVKENVLTKVDNLDDETVDNLLNEIDHEDTKLSETDKNNTTTTTKSNDSQLQSPMDIFKQIPSDIDTNETKQNNINPNKYDYELPTGITQIFEVALDAIIVAGELITTYIHDTAGKAQSLVTKMSKSDFQTQFDKRTENLIISKIKEKFPNHEIIAEESDDGSEIKFKDEVTWIIDPIDGTTNFLHGQNNVGICIGIKYKKKSILGLVYIPLWKELFFAVKGLGAYIMYKDGNSDIDKIERIYTNKKYSHIQDIDGLSNAMCILESGYYRHEKHCKLFSNIIFELLFKYKVRAIRMFGSCSVHMCMIACGRADIFFETGNLKPWDMVAGQVIVEEAGGYCLLANGDPFVCTKKEVLCCQSEETAKVMVDINILTQS